MAKAVSSKKSITISSVVIKKKPLLYRLNDSKYLLLLFAPCLLYYLIFQYAPMFGIIISFKDYNLFTGVWESDWVGWKYYRTFIESPDFFYVVTQYFFLLGVYNFIFGFPIPIIFALLLNEVKNMFFLSGLSKP